MPAQIQIHIDEYGNIYALPNDYIWFAKEYFWMNWILVKVMAHKCKPMYTFFTGRRDTF